MNYIWEFILKAKEQQIPEEKLVFKYARSYSPYMEMAQENWNMKEIDADAVVEINPFYRFYSIFKDILNINVYESEELVDCLFNILIHSLGKNDLHQGLSKQEFFKRFMWRDLTNHVFGEYILNEAEGWRLEDREVLLEEMICLYNTGVSIVLLKRVICRIFKRSIIYNNQDDPKEILIYFGEKRTAQAEKKIDVILQIFCKIDYRVRMFWEYHFGIIGMEDTMHIEQMIVY